MRSAKHILHYRLCICVLEDIFCIYSNQTTHKNWSALQTNFHISSISWEYRQKPKKISIQKFWCIAFLEHFIHVESHSIFDHVWYNNSKNGQHGFTRISLNLQNFGIGKKVRPSGQRKNGPNTFSEQCAAKEWCICLYPAFIWQSEECHISINMRCIYFCVFLNRRVNSFSPETFWLESLKF